jgi:hypothetical protein
MDHLSKLKKKLLQEIKHQEKEGDLQDEETTNDDSKAR